jgi:glutaredoxin
MKTPTPWRPFATVLALAIGALLALKGLGQRDDTATTARLVAATAPGDIRMLSSTTCRYCNEARAWLQAHRVPFDECFVERDAGCATLFARSGALGTPTFLVKGKRVIGFDRDGLLQALQPTR